MRYTDGEVQRKMLTLDYWAIRYHVRDSRLYAHVLRDGRMRTEDVTDYSSQQLVVFCEDAKRANENAGR